MATVTYQTPRAKGPTLTETGDVCWMTIGGKRVKFVLQMKAGRDDVANLVHYASGMIAVPASTINAEQISRLMSGGRVTLRFAAETCLRRIEHSIGAEALLTELNAAPVLNA